MNLYHLKSSSLTSISQEEFKLEKDLQHVVESNLETLFDLTYVSSEFSLGEFRLDTLAYDKENNAFVIIEYKKKHNASVIDQGYSYLSLMLNNKAEFILEFNEKRHQTLKRNEINWSSSRVLFISPSFNRYQKNSVNFKDIPFELWEIKRFAGGIISIDQVRATSKESIEQITTAQDSSVITQVSSEIQVHREEDHVAKLSPAMREVWDELRTNLEDWPEGSFYARQPYIGFRRGNKTTCFIHFRKDALRIDISRGEKTEDGERASNFFDLDDYKQLAIKKDWTYKSGRTGHKYAITLKRLDDVAYVLQLIQQKYKSI